MWKEDILEDLKLGEVKFESAGEFLLELKKEFGRENKESYHKMNYSLVCDI